MGDEEQELAITFAPETCTWHFNGNVAERQQSQVRQAILDVLDDEEGMTPKEIAEVMDKPYNTISKQLPQMAKEGLIIKKGYGCYMLKKPELAQTEPLWGEEHKA